MDGVGFFNPRYKSNVYNGIKNVIEVKWEWERECITQKD